MPPNPDNCRDRPVYFLLHVPKTAGQTIQVHLADHCAPGVFWQSQRRMRPGQIRCGDDLPDFARARVICGHHIGRSLEKFFTGRPIRRILLLRDPLQLQISLYNWQMMDHLAKGLGTYSFSLHLRSLPRDFITHFLLSRWLEIPWRTLVVMTDEQKYRLLNRTLAGFWFVGAHTDCNRLVEAIGPDLGVPPLPTPQNTSVELQAHTGWRLVTADSLSPAMRKAIRARYQLDQALWEEWRAAGFDPAATQPHAFIPDRRSSFLADEIVRRWFTLSRSVQLWRGSRRRATKSPAELLTEANSARDARDWERAARTYREAVLALPNAPAIWLQYGHALKESGRVAEAEQAYRRSLNLSPEIADAYLQLGHALKLQGKLDRAIEAYLRAVQLDPAAGHASAELIGLGWTVERIEQRMRGLAQPA